MKRQSIDATKRAGPSACCSLTVADLPALDDLIPLAELPKKIPAAPGGRRLHCHVPYRWAGKGLGGVVLRSVTLPGTGMFTTLAWYRAFVAEVAAVRAGRVADARPPRTGQHTDHRPNDRATATEEVLSRHGLGSRQSAP